MASFSLLRYKSFDGCIKAIRALRGSVNHAVQKLNVHQVQYRVMSNSTSNGNLTSGYIDKNVIYSRYEDFSHVDQTVVQRIFDRAKLWPNLVAMVKLKYPFRHLSLSTLKRC